jgi:phage-related protein
LFPNKETIIFVYENNLQLNPPSQMEDKFQVEYLDDAIEFLRSLNEKERKKVLYNISKAKSVTDNELFKKLTDDIWEFRIQVNRKQIRLLSFWDKRDNKNTLVIACNGFIKKTQRTPQSELEKAEKNRVSYFGQ